MTFEPRNDSVRAGQIARFTAHASGDPAPRVRWQERSGPGDAWQRVRGATATTYSFRTSRSENGSQYRAVFTNTVSSATTKVATLKVQPASTAPVNPKPPAVAPAITGQPSSETIASGSTATFSAAASGNPTPAVQWQVSSNNRASWSVVAGATSPSYSFTASSSESGFQYRAVFTNSVSSATTDAATLTVSLASTTNVNIPQAAPFTGSTTTTDSSSFTQQLQPIGQNGVSVTYVTTVSNANLTVSRSGLVSTVDGPLAANSYTVSGSDSTALGDAGTWTYTLTVNGVNISQAAPFSDTTTTTVSSTFTQQLQPIGQNGAAVTYVTAVPNANLTVSSSGLVSTVGGPLVANDYTVSGSDSTALGDAGTWSYTLTVTAGVAPTITSQPSSETVASGTTANFSAAASGSPTPTVQWQVSSNAGSTWTNVSGATSPSYSFTASSSENSNEYQAVFTNAVSSATTNTATLTVDFAPAITAQPSDETVVSGSTATFSAAASGNPTPTVQWQVSSNAGSTWTNVSGATSPSYSFTASSSENGDQFRAVFTNSVSSATTNVALLTVNSASTTSTNWSGYAATGATFTSVSGDWTVPAVTCLSDEATYSSTWIGIDGYLPTSSTVEQDGTESDCLDGSPSYDAWYEMYGDSAVSGGDEVPISHPISPGDAMTASVSVAGGTWTLAISDTTKGWNFSINIASPSPAPAQSSAEWIVERPEVCSPHCSLTPLADFGAVSFTNATATGNGVNGPITAFSESAIEMVSGPGSSTPLAMPGPLDPTGEDFTDTWEAS